MDSVVGVAPGDADGDVYGVHLQAFQNTKLLKYTVIVFFFVFYEL